MKFDPSRDWRRWSTGLYVRAQRSDGTWETGDISHLDRASLLEWLRSRGGANPWAENVVGILLGHGPLHEHEGTHELQDHE